MNAILAGEYVVPFGQFRTKTIAEVAETDEGLLWLDWARGVAKSPRFVEALSAYLDQPVMQRELDGAMARRSNRP